MDKGNERDELAGRDCDPVLIIVIIRKAKLRLDSTIQFLTKRYSGDNSRDNFSRFHREQIIVMTSTVLSL